MHTKYSSRVSLKQSGSVQLVTYLHNYFCVSVGKTFGLYQHNYSNLFWWKHCLQYIAKHCQWKCKTNQVRTLLYGLHTSSKGLIPKVVSGNTAVDTQTHWLQTKCPFEVITTTIQNVQDAFWITTLRLRNTCEDCSPVVTEMQQQSM